MAIPQGYVKIQPNTLYENVEYYIDTSISPTIPSFIQLAFPYFGNMGGGGAEAIHGGIGAVTAVDRGVYIGTKVVDSDSYVWNSNVVDGIVTGYPTLNIQCETSPDWLYVKSADAALYYEPLYEGSELQDSATFTPTTSQQSLTLEQGKVAVKEVTVEAVTAAIDSNIKASNIKLGVTILGVEGNLSADKPDQTKTVTPTKSTQTVTPDSGYELSSVTVNPIPSQYIEPTGSLSITQDGTYDVTNYATVDVSVPNPLLAATDAEMTALTTEANVGKVVKFTGTTGTYQQQRLYLIKSNVSTFTLSLGNTAAGSVTVTVEEGMTWAEWCDSSYATENEGWSFRYNASTVGYTATVSGMTYGDIELNGTAVLPTDIIQNTTYTLTVDGHSGGAGAD